MKLKKIHFLLFILLLFCGGVFLARPQFLLPEKLNEDDQAVKDLGERIVVPEEIPTVVTVSEKEKLGSQAFFQYAENGDKVIMYMKAGKAYLFRPSKRQIIDMAPIILEGKTPSEPAVFQIPE
jgi:hypothetical protein